MCKLILSILFVLCLSVPVNALRITDSSTSNKGSHSTYASLNRLNTVSTAGYQNTYGIPVGMIVAWSSQSNITSYDKMKWLECNGQTFDSNRYPELYEVLGVNRVPNLNGQFMRGTTDTSAVLTYREDTIKSHNIKVEPHTHVFNNGESSVSGSINGTAAGQRFSANANLPVTGSVNGSSSSSGGSGSSGIFINTYNDFGVFFNQYYYWADFATKTTRVGNSLGTVAEKTYINSGSSSSTTLALKDGKAKGTISGSGSASSVTGTFSGTGGGGGSVEETGELTGTYEGAEETAPRHMYVRYFIRAIP